MKADSGIRIDRMIKPSNWASLLFYEKISLYAETLTEEHARYTDKLIAKELAKERCPDIEIPRVVRVLADYKDLRQEDINPRHILKSAHGSKWNNDFRRMSSLRIINKKLEHWNKKYKSSSIERHYSFIEPRFFIEDKIEDRMFSKTGDAVVYMVRCIDGEPISIGVKVGNYQSNYDLKWTEFPNFSKVKPPFPIRKPNDLDKILEYAAALSSPFEFVRIDFYLSPDKIYFSEYTFTPAGGHISFLNNVNLERELGDKWL
jgi:hypothetical protein